MPMEQTTRAAPISRDALHEALSLWWLRNSHEGRIGPPDVQGRTPWLWIRHDDRLFRLHADTKRSGVAAYMMMLYKSGGELEWSIGTSARGKTSKVGFGSAQRRIPGFYLYAETP